MDVNRNRKRKISGTDVDDYNKKMKDDCIGRLVIMDTETTGLGNTDKIIEISLLELKNNVKTGKTYHKFINPEKPISKSATEIHKLTNEMLNECSVFATVASEITDFIGDSIIIAHNSKFDQRMLNNELYGCGHQKYPDCRFIDSLQIARYLFPACKNNQDVLCERFNLGDTIRSTTGVHGALEDTESLYLIFKAMEPMLVQKNIALTDFIK